MVRSTAALTIGDLRKVQIGCRSDDAATRGMSIHVEFSAPVPSTTSYSQTASSMDSSVPAATSRYGVGVDLWSVGCVFIFPGRTEVEQLHKVFELCGTPSEDY